MSEWAGIVLAVLLAILVMGAAIVLFIIVLFAVLADPDFPQNTHNENSN